MMGVFSYDTANRKKIRDRTKTFHADYRLDLQGDAVGERPSFLVVGDSGAGDGADHPQYHVARAMAAERHVSAVLHLGDVVYLSGAREGYEDRFIKPYAAFLKHGEDHRYDDLVFRLPFLPVYGNHDYYDFADTVPLVGSLVGLFSRSIGTGSNNGEVFERAFVETRPGRSVDGRLPYDVAAGHTRIPNRYYWFTLGNCAFIALDSNTLDVPEHARDEARSELKLRLQLAKDRRDYNRDLIETYEKALSRGWIDEPRARREVGPIIDDLVDSLKEIKVIDDTLDADAEDHDRDQLAWLDRTLAHPDVEGKWKIVYLHHPLFSSEETHTDDPDIAGVRHTLRDRLARAGVHLVLAGHAHCFEWVTPRPGRETERAMCYLVSGGGGREVRRSVLEPDRRAGAGDLDPGSRERRRRAFRHVARSSAYAGLRRNDTCGVYHYLRIDVHDDMIEVRPVGLEDDGTTVGPPVALPVLRLDDDPPGEVALEVIRVFRDREPEPVFRPLA